jgi:hypothetical protein
MFLTEPKLRRAMLKACTSLCERFGALECIITRDESPIISAFLKGKKFDAALRAGGRKEKRFRRLNGLWIDKGACTTLIIGGRGGRLWDSKGYWHLPLDSSLPKLGKAPWAVRQHGIINRW